MSGLSDNLKVTVRGLDGRPIVVTPEMLSAMPFLQLQKLREMNQNDQLVQNMLANFEHRAFTRGFVSSPDSPTNPITRAAALGVATPAYSAMKGLGILPESQKGKGLASEASLEQVKQGMIGIGEGLGESAMMYGKKARGMLGL